MRIVVYWAAAEGAHPQATVAVNQKCWMVMHRRVKALGYSLTLLTATGEAVDLPHDDCYEFDVDPSFCALAREQAFAQFLESVEDREQIAMLEPDSYLRSRIPEIAEGFDLVLLRRDRRPTPTCFRLTRGSGRAYYAEVARRAAQQPDQKKRWYADIEAQESILAHSRKAPDGLVELPKMLFGCRIEHRDFRDYCMDQQRSNPDAVMWMFNGTNKPKMLTLP